MTPIIEDKKPHSLRYNDGKLEWSLIDRTALEPMIRVLMYGAHKYTTFEEIATKKVVTGKELPANYDRSKYRVITSGRDNWRIDFKIHKLVDSLERHITLYTAGEENDAESGLPHVGHILCNALFISHYMQRGQTFIEDVKKND